MTFGKQTGWRGEENDYQAFNTNQCNNLGLWIEESLVTVSISAVSKQFGGVNDYQVFATLRRLTDCL